MSKQTLAPVKVSQEITPNVTGLHEKCKFVLRYIKAAQKQAAKFDDTRIHWINLSWKNREADGQYQYPPLPELYALHFGIAIEIAKTDCRSITEVLERKGTLVIQGRGTKTGAKYAVAKLDSQLTPKERLRIQEKKAGYKYSNNPVKSKAVEILDRDFS